MEDKKTVASSVDKGAYAEPGIKDTSGYGNKRKGPAPTVRETKGGKPS